MKITKLKWANAQRDSLKVTLDDGKEVFAPWPCETWHREHIQAFMDANTVEAEDLPPSPVDHSEAANQSREMRAMINAIANLTGKTPGQAAAAFKQAYNALN